MKKKNDSPLHIILFILVLVNVIIIRDGFLGNDKLYFALFGAVPLALYAVYRIWKQHRASDYSQN